MNGESIGLKASRRNVLTGLAIGGAGGFGIPNPLTSRALAADEYDYRAIVCILLEGGSDNWSTLVPFDEVSYNAYYSARPKLAVGYGQLGSTYLRTANDLGGFAYALNPIMQPIVDVFDSGDLAVIQNIGALVSPTSSSMFMNGSARLPKRLFSHNTQVEFVQTGLDAGGTTGWGGRIADHVSSYNAYREFTCINAAQTSSPFLFGKTTMPYAIDESGAQLLLNGREDATAAALRTITTAASDNVLRQEYAKIMARALSAGNLFASVFSQIPDADLAAIPTANNDLGKQLRAIAKAIGGARSMGMRRQVFFAKLRNWDAHAMTAEADNNFKRLVEGMKGFWQTMNGWGLGSSVTTFTLSEFGRTLADNGSGTNHGWGSAQFVMGGAVAGQQVLGRPPIVGVQSPDSVLGGRLVPTTPIDSLAATLASWMGVESGRLGDVSPNLANFPHHARDLGLFKL